MNKTERFYIFLDIDGVLYDMPFLINSVKQGQISGLHKKFKPESMQALNTLIKVLNQCYNVELVISSTWRANLEKTIKTLYENGLEYASQIQRTELKLNPFNRGIEIKNYLKDKPNNNNFVILDDEWFDFKKHFDIKNIIKTSMWKGSLSCMQVNNFLKNSEKDNILER